MITVEVKGADELQRALTELAKKTGDLRPVWSRIAVEFYRRERDLFSSQGEGAWVQLSPSYSSWKQKHFPGLPLLVLSGNLRESLGGRGGSFSVYEAEPLSLSIGTSVPYAQFHQTGTSKMPARPPIIIDDATTEKFLDIAVDALGEDAAGLGFEVKKG
jgi:phage gpG-like protein